MALSPEQVAQLRALADQLGQLGIPGLRLLDVDTKGRATGWLVQMMEQGIDTVDELMPLFEQLPEVRQRYGIVFELRDRATRGETVEVLNIRQVRDFENGVIQMMRQAGFPEGLYDTPEEIHRWLRDGFNLPRLQTRVVDVWSRVAHADPHVRAYFAEATGGVDQGDAWLAAMFLDPAQSEAALQRAVQVAEVGGTGRRMGIRVSRERVEELARLGFDASSSTDRFARVAQLRPLTLETVGERRSGDLTEDSAVAAAFDAEGGTAALQGFQRRARNRQAAFAGAGGAAAGIGGVIGLGEGR